MTFKTHAHEEKYFVGHATKALEASVKQRRKKMEEVKETENHFAAHFQHVYHLATNVHITMQSRKFHYTL